MAKDFFKGMNKTQTKDYIRRMLQGIAVNEEFESDFLRDLISEKHYFLSISQELPILFRKKYAINAAGYDFQGLFPARGWHGVSWAKCVDEPGPIRTLTQALRDAAFPVVAKYKAHHPACERCGSPTDDVDHVDPEFKDIVQIAIGGCCQEELDDLMSTFDFWNGNPFIFPKDSEAYKRFVAAHDGATLMAVCKECHLQAAKDRKAK